MTRLLFEASAPVRATLAQVRQLIDDESVLGPMLGERGRSYVDVDHPSPGVVGFQGHWWYRGEISAAPGPVVTYRVFNIARSPTWVVALANRLFIGYRRTVEQAATRTAAGIEAQLATD
jgi:hypothetical protein